MGFFNSRMTDFLKAALGRKKPIRKQQPRRFVPWFEELEARRVLSITFTTVPVTQTNFDGAAITGVQTVATDTAADQVVYSQSGLPTGLILNSSSGLISGTISTSADASSPYTVNLTATDEVTSQQATASFLWNVNPDPITFTNPGPQTNFNGAAINLATGGADSLHNALSYSATGLPTGLTISSTTGAITGTINDAVIGISSVTNTVNPTITTAAANSLTAGESITIAGVGGATGVNGTFVVASVLTTTTFTITDATAPGVYTSGGTVLANFSATVTASDATANASNSETFTWNVNPTPVSVTAPAAQTNNDGASVSLQVQATDSISGNHLVYSASNLPSGLTIASSTGIISGQIGSTAHTGSPYSVTVTATDATANTSESANFSWTVTTGPVTLTSPGNQTNVGLDVVKLQLSATDSTSGDTLTYSATGLPTGLSIDHTTGLISGTIAQTANSGSPYTVTVTATDITANSSNSQTFTWTVNPGPIKGVVFFDSNGNGKLDTTDPRLAGVTVQLTGTATTSVNITGVTNTVDPTITTATADNLTVGNSITIAGVGGATGVIGTFTVASILSTTSFTITTTTAPGAYTSGGTVSTTSPISATCVTDAHGNFSFLNAPVGTYTLKVNPLAALNNGKPSIGSLVSPGGITVTNSNTAVAGTAARGGLAGSAISITQFLTTSQFLNEPFGPIGTGIAVVNHAPTVSKAIAAVSLSSTSTTSTVDLAGHFTDGDITNSSITMNITDGLTAVNIKNVTNTVNPTITTSAAHNLAVGDMVTISGIQGATGVNGTFAVASVPSATTFTITLATAPGVFIPGGTVTGSLHIASVTNTVNPTITTTTAHKLVVGESITIAGVTGATGVNGTFTVTSVPTATTFTITTAAPGAYTAGGTIATPAINISGVTNTVNPTITTTTPNKLVVGETVTIANVVGALGVNGTFVIASVPTATTFTVKLAQAPGVYTTSGSLTASDSITGVTNVIDPTITTTAAHHLAVGDTITISGVVGATGVNGTFKVVSVPSATSFTIATASAPGVYTSGGAVSKLLTEKVNLTLFDTLAPQTVANFFDYIKSGEYDNSIFSRLVHGFVLQGGGAKFLPASGSTSANISSIAIGPTIPNEFKTPNTFGTIAMAQSGSNASSATDQFFINLGNNSTGSTFNDLDSSSFAVFGKLADSASQTAINALAATNTLSASGSTAATANSTVDMNNIPLTGYTAGTSTATSSTFAADANSTNFMTINNVTINKQSDYLTYSVTSSNPTIVAASLDSVHNEQLTLTRGTATGTATVTVTATDRYGLSVTSTITVTVS